MAALPEIKMSNDTQVKQAVLDELNWEPGVNSAHIGVTAKDGVVSLLGHVESYTEKYAAETAVRRVKDVKGVAEELEVRLPLSVKRADDDIAAAAISRLKWNVSVPSDAVKVKVEKGWVTLTGEVDWHFQAESARDDIRFLMGVIGVSNLFTIKARPNAANISNDIMHALHRTWFDPKNVKVTAFDGKVKLTGSVDSWSDRETAGTTAWAAPGATSGENDIRVN
jgi:osmotically-inducible protein OsmY